MDNKFNINATTVLNNGVQMPVLGLGTWQITGEAAEKAVGWALKSGYRHIDTATAYHNEVNVGKALAESGVSRKDLFITTKLWNTDHGYDNTIAALEKSLRDLGLTYVDLYLVHWPVSGMYTETWKAMEHLLAADKCRAIGVSNFTIRHLDELLKEALVIPAVNQMEFSPYLYQKDLLDYCNSKKIQVEAYSPLTRGNQLDDPELASIAAKYGKSTAQILIRWSLQSGLVVIPKASSLKHIQENADVFDFEISAEDMQKVTSFHKDLRICWNPEKEA
ncbi:MAG: aldo/keto reductase [Dehalococcoidales bacterium]